MRPVAKQLQKFDYNNVNGGVFYGVRAKVLHWRQLGWPVLSSEGAPRDYLTVVEVWSWAPDGCFLPGRPGRLLVGLTWDSTRLDSTRPVHACAETNTNAKSGGTVGGDVFYSVHFEFTCQGRALRAIKGDAEKPQWLGGYKYGYLASRLGSLESERVKCGHESCGTRS
jgi:hypothetical protein